MESMPAEPAFVPADYHMHLFLDNEPWRNEELAERLRVLGRMARERAVGEIGISEHIYRFRQFREVMRDLYEGEGTHPYIRDWLSNDFRADLDLYVETILSARLDVPLRLGLEVDYLPGRMELIRQILSPYPWDYLLGSVHFLGRWGFDIAPEIGWPDDPELIDEGWLQYWQTWRQAAECGLFSSMAHPDLFKKFGHRPSPAAAPQVAEAARTALVAAARAGVAIEINSAGLRKPVGEIYPSLSLLQEARAVHLPITLGSDAHRAEDVGRGLAEAIAFARRAGYAEMLLFCRQRREAIALP
ncbi:MAG: histidinol-phosphatase HisJ family protein [Limnochordales bacterium]|nr:histidinol-phosphatase HisJ family protein [Limnochordales bacterium]